MDIYEWKIIYKDGEIDLNDVLNALKQACEKYNLDITQIHDLDICNSTMFNNVLLGYVNHILFKPVKALYLTDTIRLTYDKEKILSMLDIYIYLCNTFNKRICINGFNSLCGIDNSTIHQHKNDNGLNVLHGQINKTLLNADNTRQQDRANDSKQAILNLAYNNYLHGWNGEIKSNEIKSTVKTLSDIKTERVETSADRVQNARFSLQDNNG